MYVGSIVRIKNNIGNILGRFGYEPKTIEALAAMAGTEHIVREVSTEGRRKYLIVDLAVEIPVQCCSLVS